jgi:hypothetical protein
MVRQGSSGSAQNTIALLRPGVRFPAPPLVGPGRAADPQAVEDRLSSGPWHIHGTFADIRLDALAFNRASAECRAQLVDGAALTLRRRLRIDRQSHAGVGVAEQLLYITYGRAGCNTSGRIGPAQIVETEAFDAGESTSRHPHPRAKVVAPQQSTLGTLEDECVRLPGQSLTPEVVPQSDLEVGRQGQDAPPGDRPRRVIPRVRAGRGESVHDRRCYSVRPWRSHGRRPGHPRYCTVCPCR